MTLPVLDVSNPDTADAIAPDLAAQSRALVAGPSYAVATAEEAATAVRDREQLADFRRRVVEYFAPLKGMAYQLHKKLCDRERAIVGPIDLRDTAIRGALSVFKRAEDAARVAREAEAAAAQRRADEDRAAHEAAILELAGDPDLATAIVEEAITAPPTVITFPAAPVAGLKFRKVWKWRASDPAAVPRGFLMLDEVKIGGYVRSMKSSGSIPGIDIYSVDEPVR